MKKLSLKNVCSEINGIISWGCIQFSMRQLIVTRSDEEVERYWVMRLSEEFEDGMEVKAGDKLGWQGCIPQVIMISAPRVIFPKTIKFNCGESAMIEGYFWGDDGKYYIGRMCSLLLLLDGYAHEEKYFLSHETIEQDFYMADGSIILGKNVEDIASLHGFRENEIPVVDEDTNLVKWLEEMRLKGKINFLSPYDILLEFEKHMERLVNALEHRIYSRDDKSGESH